jgi:hypothetical protein
MRSLDRSFFCGRDPSYGNTTIHNAIAAPLLKGEETRTAVVGSGCASRLLSGYWKRRVTGNKLMATPPLLSVLPNMTTSLYISFIVISESLSCAISACVVAHNVDISSNPDDNKTELLTHFATRFLNSWLLNSVYEKHPSSIDISSAYGASRTFIVFVLMTQRAVAGSWSS